MIPCRFGAQRLATARPTGKGVGAAAPQGDPIRPEIALLEHTHGNAARARQLDRDAVVRPAVAEQDDVGNGGLMQEDAEKAPPFGEAAAEIHRAELWPENPVAAAQIDSVYRVAPAGDLAPEPHEKGSCQALQEKKRPLAAETHHHRAPLRPSPSLRFSVPQCPDNLNRLRAAAGVACQTGSATPTWLLRAPRRRIGCERRHLLHFCMGPR